MSCQRSSHIDPATYLTDPASPDLAEFRAHFPECEECSLAVAEWTAFEESLAMAGSGGGGHPDVEKLIALVDAPGSLKAAEFEGVRAHVGSCKTCGDEVAAMRAFDFERLEQTAPMTAGRALRQVSKALKDLGSSLLGRGKEATWSGEVVVSAPEPQLAFQSKGMAEEEAAGADAVGVLVGRGGSLDGKVFPILPGRTRLGREPECEIRLRGVDFLRFEASLDVEGDSVRVKAHDSRRPPTLNGVPTDEAELSDADELRVGSQLFLFRRLTRSRGSL